PSNNTASDFASGISTPVDIKVANDGSLYYLARGVSSVFRIQFNGTAPSISTHPSNQTVMQGQPVTFTVAANGTAPFTYQWQRNQVNIGGATSPSFTLNPATFADDQAKFRCVVTNAFGNATSNEATLTVNAPPTISTHPSDQTVTQGQPVTFNVAAIGSAPLVYQWQRNQVNIGGATSPSFTLNPATFADDQAKFRCVVTNAFGNATSNEATLTVNAPPTISTHPSDQTVTQGQPVTFNVAAIGSAPLIYQWQRNQVNIGGATAASYTINATSASDNGAKFRCVVTNGFGNATSNEATLAVNAGPPALTTEVGTDRAIALDSVTLMRDPLPLIDPFNLSSDNRTRVALFAMNLPLGPGENATSIAAQAEDPQHITYPLTVEYAGAVPGFSWLTEVIFVMPGNFPAGQDMLVSIAWHAQATNKVRIKTK
ncbi:MAG TPA: immunoglobulin domain-containing protein, partial [Pyrinomonadaceae bacterium]|nr:immunoglobulin domain-containing protein [Pyrinomonadaceae bacterium]